MERIQVNASTVCAAAGIFTAGGVAGWLLCRYRLARSYDERLSKEVTAVKEHYINHEAEAMSELAAIYRAKLEGSGNHGDDEQASVETDDSGTAEEPDDDDPGLEGYEDEADAEPEGEVSVPDNPVVDRNTSRPYPISLAEFCDPPVGYQQITISYYAADGVLVDEKDETINQIEQTVGALDALKFGGISEDPHLRYVRNEKLEIDFEIELKTGSYAELVLNYGRPK